MHQISQLEIILNIYKCTYYIYILVKNISSVNYFAKKFNIFSSKLYVFICRPLAMTLKTMKSIFGRYG